MPVTFSDDIEIFFERVRSPPVGDRAILGFDFSLIAAPKATLDFFVETPAVRCELCMSN